MTLTAQVYFSFRSPYSYLATPKLDAMVEDWDLALEVKPVYPIAVRDPGFFSREPAAWIPYLQRDVKRVAEHEGIPFRWPRPDPIVQDMETRRIAVDQPYIRRLTWLGVAAARRGPESGLAFIREVGHALWGEGVEDWHLDDRLGPILARAGLGLGDLQAELDADPEGFEAEVAANQAALEAAGHWGVPTLVFDGEPFFGQDRLDLALWRMKAAGLRALA